MADGEADTADRDEGGHQEQGDRRSILLRRLLFGPRTTARPVGRVGQILFVGLDVFSHSMAPFVL
jgi:hypothetical protein